jgi:hypothetical protein
MEGTGVFNNSGASVKRLIIFVSENRLVNLFRGIRLQSVKSLDSGSH